MKKNIVIATCIIFVVIVLTSCSSSTKKSIVAPTQESKSTAPSKVNSAPKSLDTTGQVGRQEDEDLFVMRDGWIYTFNNYRSMAEGIYKTKSLDNAKSFILICSDKAGSINVIGNQIYYINVSDGNKIYRINTDGTNKQKLLDTPASSLYISNDTMFFQDNSKDDKGNMKSWLYSAKTDGSKLKCLYSQYTKNVYISDGWIYFIEGSWGGNAIFLKDISKMRIDGTEKSIVTNNKVWRIAVYGDWIYYNDNDNGNFSNLYKIKKDGTQITKITNDNLICKLNEYTITFNWKIYGNYIYYGNGSDGGKLYRISTSGTDKRKLDDEKCTGLFLADESNFVHVLLWYKIDNNNNRVYKEFNIDNATGEVIDYGQYLIR